MIITQTKTEIIPIMGNSQFVNVTVYSIVNKFDEIKGIMTYKIESKKAMLNLSFVSALKPTVISAGKLQYSRDDAKYSTSRSDLKGGRWYGGDKEDMKITSSKKVLQVIKAHGDLWLSHIEYITLD